MAAQALPVIREYLPQEHGARCDLCPLKGSTVVPPRPSATETKLVFVGEAPGRKEEIQGVPFCLVPETLVLMADLRWKPLDTVQVGDEIITVEEDVSFGDGGRRWQIAQVTQRHDSEQECWSVETSLGELIGTGDHRVLAVRLQRTGAKTWRRIDRLIAGKTRQSCIASVGRPWVQSHGYSAAWLSGFLDGEGHVSSSQKPRLRHAGRVGFSQNDGPVLDRACQHVAHLGFSLRKQEKRRPYPNSGNTCQLGVIRGPLHDVMRFLGVVRPERLVADFQRIMRRERKFRPASRGLEWGRVIRRTQVGKRRVIDITTTAGTFIANGFVVHNCGQTGQFLRGLCREVDIDFPSAALQNAALCRSNIDRENDEAAVCCAPRLLKELAALPPSVPIVTLGKSSTLSVLGVRSIMHSRGFVWTARELDPNPPWKAAKKAKLRASPKWKTLWLKAQIIEGRSKLAGRTVLPTIHPAFVLRSDTWLPILKIDLDRVSRWVRGELTHEMLLENGPYVVVSKRDAIRRELKKLGPDIDVDVETGASTDGGKD
jgi:uracil-DNA glycosylase